MNQFYIPDEIWKHILEFALPQTTLGDVTVSNVILPDEEGNHTYRDKIKKFCPSPNGYFPNNFGKIKIPLGKNKFIDLNTKYGDVGTQYYIKRAHFVMYKKYLEICLTEFHKKIHFIERKRKLFWYSTQNTQNNKIIKSRYSLIYPITEKLLDIETQFFNTYKYNQHIRDACMGQSPCFMAHQNCLDNFNKCRDCYSDRLRWRNYLRMKTNDFKSLNKFFLNYLCILYWYEYTQFTPDVNPKSFLKNIRSRGSNIIHLKGNLLLERLFECNKSEDTNLIRGKLPR